MLISKNGQRVADVDRLDLIEGSGITFTLTERTGLDELRIQVDTVPLVAAHVADGSTVNQLRDALVAAGLMAAS